MINLVAIRARQVVAFICGNQVDNLEIAFDGISYDGLAQPIKT